MTYTEIMTAIDNNTVTMAQVCTWLNANGSAVTKTEADSVVNQLNMLITTFNDKQRADRVNHLLHSVERSSFWTVYATDPTYKGVKLTCKPQDGYSLQETSFRLKFKALEKEAQEGGDSLCAFKNWEVAIAIFNRYLQDSCLESGKGCIKQRNAVDNNKLQAALKNFPDFFKENTKNNRILMLKHICNMMCGEIGIKPMSFDVKYLALTMVNAKYGVIKSKNDQSLVDEIITVIGLCVDTDENGKRRTMYDFNNKGGFIVKAKK